MPPSSSNQPVDDATLSAVMSRAAELRAEKQRAVSEAEMLSLAAEMGFDEQLVERALRDVRLEAERRRKRRQRGIVWSLAGGAVIMLVIAAVVFVKSLPSDRGAAESASKATEAPPKVASAGSPTLPTQPAAAAVAADRSPLPTIVEDPTTVETPAPRSTAIPLAAAAARAKQPANARAPAIIPRAAPNLAKSATATPSVKSTKAPTPVETVPTLSGKPPAVPEPARRSTTLEPQPPPDEKSSTPTLLQLEDRPQLKKSSVIGIWRLVGYQMILSGRSVVVPLQPDELARAGDRQTWVFRADGTFTQRFDDRLWFSGRWRLGLVAGVPVALRPGGVTEVVHLITTEVTTSFMELRPVEHHLIAMPRRGRLVLWYAGKTRPSLDTLKQGQRFGRFADK